MQNSIRESVDKIKANQLTIDNLLVDKKIYLKNMNNDIFSDKWIVDTVYDDIECNLGFAFCDELDGVFPNHLHENIQEYLICIRGKFVIIFKTAEKEVSRIVNYGECVAIPPGSIHSVTPLEKNTKLAFICVPREKGYSRTV